MGKQTVQIRRYGNSIQVKIRKQVESFDATYMTRNEIVDHCYWLGVTNRVSLSRETIEEMLRENRVIV